MMHHLLYIDPGSGSYFIQVLIAALLGGWFWVKNYWTRIRLFFGKKNKGEIKEPESPGPFNQQD